MKELNVFEMEQVAAGTGVVGDVALDIASRIASGALGAVVTAVWGTLIGGTQSGANGGLLGFGLIGNGIGAVWGFIAGGILGGAGGFAAGWDTTLSVVIKSFTNAVDGQFVPWSQ